MSAVFCCTRANTDHTKAVLHKDLFPPARQQIKNPCTTTKIAQLRSKSFPHPLPPSNFKDLRYLLDDEEKGLPVTVCPIQSRNNHPVGPSYTINTQGKITAFPYANLPPQKADFSRSKIFKN